MTRKLQIVIAAVLIGILVAFIYFQLGGNRPIVFEVITKDKLIVYGQSFKGKYNDQGIERLFVDAREFAKSHADASVAIINYQTNQKDSIKQFIGFISDSIYNNENYRMDEVTFVSARISSHNLVMPKPDQVHQEAQIFAKNNGYKLDDFSIEVYHGESDLEILFPCKAN